MSTKIGSGATPRGGENSYKSTGITLIRSLNVYDFRFEYNRLAFIGDEQANNLANVEVLLNDILLNITGASVARCCIVPPSVLPARVNQHVSIVRIESSIAEPYYVLNVINSPYYKHYLLTLAQGGATREALTKEKIENFEIPLPPLPTQRKIAAILSVYDDLIENNTRRIRILEEMAQAIYREWFVKFRYPGHEGVSMLDTEVGLAPEGWEIKRIDQIANLHRGKHYSSSDLDKEKGKPFINLKCIERDGGFRQDGIKRFAGVSNENQNAIPGDIVVALTDMTQERRIVARASRIPDIGSGSYVYSMDLIKVVPNSDVQRGYLYAMLRFSNYSDEVKEKANGVNVLHLNPANVADFRFIFPPKSLRDLFGEMSEIFYRQCDVLNLRNANLRRTRDLLLPRLVSGDLEVSELEIME
jgi:type I restriction enzyme S subunit